MRVELVQTTEAHVLELGRWMRRADAAECEALGLDVRLAPLHAWAASDFCTSLLVDGRAAAVGGVVLERTTAAALAPRAGIAWLLTSLEVEKAPMSLHRAAKAWLREMRAHADVLWNRVDARHVVSLRWLEALGFRVFPARPHGPGELPFHLVVREL